MAGCKLDNRVLSQNAQVTQVAVMEAETRYANRKQSNIGMTVSDLMLAVHEVSVPTSEPDGGTV